MKNRIVSLFQLDDLLAPATNGHSRSTKRETRRKRRGCAGHESAAVGRAPSLTKKTAAPIETPVAKSFDTGNPIRCEHSVAYPAVQPVQLPGSPSTTEGTTRAESFGIEVEAFEDDGQGIQEPSLQVTSEEEPSLGLSEDYIEDEPAVAPQAEASFAIASEAPHSFAAQMDAVEADLAELAERVQHPPPNSTPGSPAADEEAAGPRTPAASKDHRVFDTMAKGMNYATEFRLPPVQLSQVFSALDQQLDADDAGRVSPSAKVGAEPTAPTMPGGDVLLADLVGIAPAARQSESAVQPTGSQSLAAAIDIKHEVQLVPQQTGYSCWAAGAAMIVGWRDRISIDPSEIARATGYWAQYATGLPAEDTGMFNVWRLRPEAAQTYTVQGFADLLQRYGPLWVASAEPGPHIRVVTGMVGDGTPSGTLVYVNDPWEMGMATFRLPNHGAQYTESYQRFVDKQETLGRQEIRKQGIYVAHA